MTLDEKIKLSENQSKVIKDKYLRDDTVEQWLRGVAHNIALAELLYDKRLESEKRKSIFKDVSYAQKDGMFLIQDAYKKSKERYANFMQYIKNLETLAATDEAAREIVSTRENEFYSMLSNFEFLPNTPTLINAGRALQQLSGCFVLPVEDSIDEQDGWADAVRSTMIIHKSGGGTGFNFSKVRPKDDVVKKTKKVASGPLTPMEILDATTGGIKQGGVRRGANMGVLRVDHPDIIDFITAKAQKGKLENFNISVALTDKFMEAYKQNIEYELINPRDGSVSRKESARKIFDLIVENAHKNGDPGIIFVDTINKLHPLKEKIEATNPCGEMPLLPNESCNLGSIALPKYISGKKIDQNKLEQDIHLMVRFLDNVIDMNNFPLPEIEAMTKSNRKIGLGLMGWAETLIMLGIPYDSKEAVREAEKIMKFIDETALKASIELAKERGEFPNAHNSAYSKQRHRPRNATRTTIAPTGTIALAAGLQGSGIEPFYSIAYKRYNALAIDAIREGKTPDEKDVFYEKNNLFAGIAAENNWFGYKNENDLWEAIVKNKGSVKGLEDIPIEMQKLFHCAHDIKPEAHIEMQAAFQRYTNNAVSKTINFKTGTTKEEIAKAYLMAYEQNLKGLTIYIDGSKDRQVLNLEQMTAMPKLPSDRPKIMVSITRREKFGEKPGPDNGPNKLYVTKGYYLPPDRVEEIKEMLEKEGALFEVFGNSAAFSPKDFATMTAHGKAISRMLQKGIPPEEIAKIYLGLPDGTIAWEEGYANLSLEDALAKAILGYPKKAKITERGTLACPGCNSIDYIIKREGGCDSYTCCGYSKKCS